MPLLPLHILSLLFSLFWIFRSEKDGLAWMRGKIQTIDHAKLRRYHLFVWLGLGGLIVSGFFMFWPGRNYYFSDPTFLVKMGFVAALIINSFVIDVFLKVAAEKPFAEVSKNQKTGLFISGGASMVAWVGAITMGLML